MNPLIFGIDFDGTCVTHEFPNIGKDIGAVPVLRDIVAAGHKLIRDGSTGLSVEARTLSLRLERGGRALFYS